MSVEPELIADYACDTGENPLWHPVEQRLYWLDIPAGRIFRYDPESGFHEQCFQSADAIGGMTFQADGSFLLFMSRGRVCVWKEGRLDPFIEEIPAERETRFNDIIADPIGRVFAGTMPSENRPGHVYRIRRDGSYAVVQGGLGVSNGFGFTPDRTGLYHTDSDAREIYLYDYEAVTGEVSNRRVFARVPEGEGNPDGLTVDAAGFVWSARWDGACLVRYAPDGDEVLRVEMPTPKVSSVTFGGADLTDMYITTAGGNDKETNGSGAGALYRINLGIQGVADFPSRIGIAG